jgi:hypothetical protein
MLPPGVGDVVARALLRVAAAFFFAAMFAHAVFIQVRNLGRDGQVLLGLARKEECCRPPPGSAATEPSLPSPGSPLQPRVGPGCSIPVAGAAGPPAVRHQTCTFCIIQRHGGERPASAG